MRKKSFPKELVSWRGRKQECPQEKEELRGHPGSKVGRRIRMLLASDLWVHPRQTADTSHLFAQLWKLEKFEYASSFLRNLTFRSSNCMCWYKSGKATAGYKLALIVCREQKVYPYCHFAAFLVPMWAPVYYCCRRNTDFVLFWDMLYRVPKSS